MSEAPKAPEVRELVIRVFMAARRSQEKPAPPPALPLVPPALPPSPSAAITARDPEDTDGQVIDAARENPGRSLPQLARIVAKGETSMRSITRRVQGQGFVVPAKQNGVTVWFATGADLEAMLANGQQSLFNWTVTKVMAAICVGDVPHAGEIAERTGHTIEQAEATAQFLETVGLVKSTIVTSKRYSSNYRPGEEVTGWIRNREYDIDSWNSWSRG